MLQAQPDLNKNYLLTLSPIKEWLAEMRNTFGALLPDQQQALRDDPIRLCPDNAAVRWFGNQTKSANAIMKTRNELEKFQRIYGNGTRPNPTTWGTPDEKKLGKRIANHINSFREFATKGENNSYPPLKDEMLQLYRELNIEEFRDGKDETNHTLITKEKLAEWRAKQGRRTSKRGRQGGEVSDKESDNVASNNSNRSTRSMVTNDITAATSTDSGTSEPAAKRRKKKAVAVSCEWTDNEVEKLESLVKEYGKEWALFEGMNYIPAKTKKQMISKWKNVEQKRMKVIYRNRTRLLNMLKKKK